jgi:hypothetical protein
MPDLPIDTLFIVGLLLASFIGKLMEGKAKKRKEVPTDQTERNREEEFGPTREKNLRDILRETFGEVIEEPSPPVVSEIDSSLDYAVSEKRDNLSHKAKIKINEQTPKPSKSVIYNSDISSNNTRQWLRNEALGSKISLRRSFLVKEVLDQPPGLR